MRLILYHPYLYPRKPRKLPDDTQVFYCAEEFSVGPLTDWNAPKKFKQIRTVFWQESIFSDHPDRKNAAYAIWQRAFPKHGSASLINNDILIEEGGERLDFERLIRQTDTFEIWTLPTVQGRVLQWYVIAELDRLDIDPSNVSLCHFPKELQDIQRPGFWSDMLLDTADRRILAHVVSQLDWQQMLAYWAAVAGSPRQIDPQLFETADDATRDTLKALRDRYPNAETGLTNLQTRLLKSTKTNRTKMAYVIANAMAAGMDENDLVGDGTLQAELEEMSRANDPLVAIEGTGSMRNCEVWLTTHGADKLRRLET